MVVLPSFGIDFEKDTEKATRNSSHVRHAMSSAGSVSARVKEEIPSTPRFFSRARPAQAHWMSREEAIMGTSIRVELWHEDPMTGEAAMAAVMEEMHRIDRAMSPFKPESELSRLNREAAKAPVPVSEEMFELIARSIGFSKLAEGAFDITFASVGCMFDYRKGIKPAAEKIAAPLPATASRHTGLDRTRRTIEFASGNLQ